MTKTWIAVGLAAALFAFAACDALTESVNDAAAKEETFEEELDEMPIVGVGAVCPPALLTFDDLLADIDWWSDAKGHLKDLAIEAMDYEVKKNETPADVTVRLYLTETTDATQISEDDFIGVTELIPANTTTDDWTPVDLATDAEDRLTELVMESDTEFAICAKIPEVEDGTVAQEDVNLTLGFQVVATATFVPISED